MPDGPLIGCLILYGGSTLLVKRLTVNQENRVRYPESPKNAPVVKMVNTPGLKLGAQACWFDSSQGYKIGVVELVNIFPIRQR